MNGIGAFAKADSSVPAHITSTPNIVTFFHPRRSISRPDRKLVSMEISTCMESGRLITISFGISSPKKFTVAVSIIDASTTAMNATLMYRNAAKKNDSPRTSSTCSRSTSPFCSYLRFRSFFSSTSTPSRKISSS